MPADAISASALGGDLRASIAVDLGAESCRVSLLRWRGGIPHIELIHRFRHAPRQTSAGLHWDLAAILSGVDHGLALAAQRAPEGVRSLGVDGWAVDYVRLGPDGQHLSAPFCYRDSRTAAAESSLHARLPRHTLRALTAIQLQPLNTVYQHHADTLAGTPDAPWLNLPEYLLFRWGAEPVAELTNATHTGLLGIDNLWSAEVFAAAGLPLSSAPRLVPPGTPLGLYTGPITALHGAQLIAPCCHDTASAIAGIPDAAEDWAYISSGTWSLVGTLLSSVCNTAEAAAGNFTNLGAAGGRVLFHKGIPGMWLMQQALQAWRRDDLTALLQEAAAAPPTPSTALLDLADPSLSEPGGLPARINAQRSTRNLPPLEEQAAITRLILDSLASTYAAILADVARITGKHLRRIYVVGGGSQNELLNQLTASATSLPVVRGSVESSTLGNFAVQLATLSGSSSAGRVASAARLLADSARTPIL